MPAEMKLENPADLERLRGELAARTDSTRVSIAVCAGTGCRAQGSMDLLEAFRAGLAEAEVTDETSAASSLTPDAVPSSARAYSMLPPPGWQAPQGGTFIFVSPSW